MNIAAIDIDIYTGVRQGGGLVVNVLAVMPHQFNLVGTDSYFRYILDCSKYKVMGTTGRCRCRMTS